MSVYFRGLECSRCNRTFSGDKEDETLCPGCKTKGVKPAASDTIGWGFVLTFAAIGCFACGALHDNGSAAVICFILIAAAYLKPSA